MHFTRAPPALITLTVFQILMGFSVLNLLYQLHIFLVEICFIYTLKLGVGAAFLCRPMLQFVIELPDSPKTEEKGCFG